MASSLNLVCAQRLVRCICPRCAEPSRIPTEALIDIGFSDQVASEFVPTAGHGCGECNETGYKGRIGLFEVMPISPMIREAVLTGASSLELRRQALNEGMVTLRQSGLRKIADGVTTVDEVFRETSK